MHLLVQILWVEQDRLESNVYPPSPFIVKGSEWIPVVPKGWILAAWALKINHLYSTRRLCLPEDSILSVLDR
jgi:hypothetical protein